MNISETYHVIIIMWFGCVRFEVQSKILPYFTILNLYWTKIWMQVLGQTDNLNPYDISAVSRSIKNQCGVPWIVCAQKVFVNLKRNCCMQVLFHKCWGTPVMLRVNLVSSNRHLKWHACRKNVIYDQSKWHVYAGNPKLVISNMTWKLIVCHSGATWEAFA